MSEPLRATVPSGGDALVATQPQGGVSGPVAAAQLEPGTVLKDTYRILRKLGEGGMGAVYLAEHSAIRKKVAIKVLGPAYLHQPELAARFLREARAAAMIESEHVIAIHDFGTTPAGAAFFVMEYLQGEDLGQLIRREGPLPWARVRPMVLQICRALHVAHERGIYHRDMKPDNCYRLDRAGDVIKVLDFGIAKFASVEHEEGKPLTHAGMIFGTPEYMSPEQARGAAQDRRVDVYATGVILFELMTGARPFAADSFMGLLHKQMFEAPPRPGAVRPDAGVPAEVEAIILKAMQKDPDLRFQSMVELAAAIEAVGSGAPPVTVVDERLESSVPSGQALAFRGGPSAPRRRAWKLPVAAGFVAALATVAALAVLTGAPPAPVATVPVAAAPVAPAAASAPATHPDLLATSPSASAASSPELLPLAPVPKVSLKIATGAVAAEVIDAGGVRLGSTADPGGLQLPRSATAIELVLRADGYEDQALRVVPDRDRELEQPLRRKARRGKPGAAKSAPPVAPPAAPPAAPKKVDPGSPDLIPLGG